MKTVTFNIVPASGYEKPCHRQNLTSRWGEERCCVCAAYCSAVLRGACPRYDPDRMHPKQGASWTDAELDAFYEARDVAMVEYRREYTE